MTVHVPASEPVAARQLPAAPARTWADRWFDWRNRLLSSRLFQRRAASFALTRPIAQRRARSLFDLVAGFVYSQVLLACVRLKLFDILAAGPQTALALAQRVDLPAGNMQRLLDAAVSLRLVERRSHDRYGLGVLGAPMAGNEALAAMVEHHTALYADLADPLALLRGERGAARLAGYWPYSARQQPQDLHDEQVRGYSALMSASQPLVAGEILDAWPMDRYHCLLDIGGGEGTFLTEAAARTPGLKLMLFDLPAVVERGRAKLAEAGLAARCNATGGDFFLDALPSGADIATLVRVVHDHDDADVLTLLRSARRALAPGGTLLLAEPMAGTAGAEPMGDAYFGIYLLAMGRGQPRTEARLVDLLEMAGFGEIRRIPTRMPLQTSILVAVALAERQIRPTASSVNIN